MSKKPSNQKSRRKSKTSTRPRTEAAYFRTAPDTSRIELAIDAKTGRVSPGMACEAAYTSVTYERENAAKGEKAVNRVFSRDGNVALDADAALRDFEVCVAIDTNTTVVDGRRRSVIGVVVTDWQVYGVPYCIEVADIPLGWEERVGWTLALNRLCVDGFLMRGQSTAILVDAHLGHLEAINRGKEAIIEDCLLPEGWVMSYASADAGAEFVANRLLRMADRTATLVMRLLRVGSVSLPDGPAPGALHGTIKVIHSRNSFQSWEELHTLFNRSIHAAPEP